MVEDRQSDNTKTPRIRVNKNLIIFLVIVAIIAGCIIGYNVEKYNKQQADNKLVEDIYQTLVTNERNLTYSNEYVQKIESEITFDSTLEDVKNKKEICAWVRHNITVKFNAAFDELSIAMQAKKAEEISHEVALAVEKVRNDAGLSHGAELPWYYENYCTPIDYWYYIDLEAQNGDSVYVSRYLHDLEYSRYPANPDSRWYRAPIYVIKNYEDAGATAVLKTYDKKDTSNNNSSSNNNHSHSSNSYKDDPYDVHWYDDPDDFADEWADEFDSYDDAYEYWEDEY